MDGVTFICSICGEGSQDICIYCTKDACENHLCDRCKRCSDCCECDFKSVTKMNGALNGTTVGERMEHGGSRPEHG